MGFCHHIEGVVCDNCRVNPWHIRSSPMPPIHEWFGAYTDPFERGAAVAFGLMGMALAIKTWKPRARCADCGYDQSVPHPNAAYDRTLYECDDTVIRCGLCADEDGSTDVRIIPYEEQRT